MNAAAFALLVITTTLGAQTPGGRSTSKEAAADPLKFMRGTLEPIRLSASTSAQPLRLSDTPAFRLGDQGADIVKEGAIYFWLDASDRPAAAVQVFLIRDANAPDGIWLQEFVSLYPGPLVGQRTRGGQAWSPEKPGLDFKTVPNAPRPAAAPAQRDRQMRALARDFHASDFFHERSWTELRLLPTPVARYGKAGAAVTDGALFAFVTGTDPEAFLFLEVRAGASGPEWQYAFAPMTCWELKGTLGGRAVWSSPVRRDAHDPTQPYFTVGIPDR